MTDLARALVAASLFAVAAAALGLAVALLLARRRVAVRAGLATTLTFAALTLAASAAIGALAVGIEDSDLAMIAAALGLVASLSFVRAAFAQGEHAALVGGAAALEEARRQARDGTRALAAADRLAERLDEEGIDADVSRLLLDASRSGLPGTNVALRPADAPVAEASVSVPLELDDEPYVLVASPGEGGLAEPDRVRAVLAALARTAELGGHRRTDALRAHRSRERHAAVTELELRLRQADDTFGAAHATAQAAAQYLGALWIDAGPAGQPVAAFALGGEPRVEAPAQLTVPLVAADGVLRAGLEEPPDEHAELLLGAFGAALGRRLAGIEERRAGERRASRLATLREVAAAAQSVPADAPMAIVRAVRRALDADAAVIYRLDGRTPTIVQAIGVDAPTALDGIAGQAVATARAIVDRDGAFLAASPLADMAAGVAAPIPGVPSAAGAISVLFREDGIGSLDEEDARDLVAFAQIAAIAFVRLDLDHELDRRERLRAGFLEIAEGLIGTREPGETLAAVADAARRALRADAAVVIDESGLPTAPDGHSASLLSLAAREGRAIFCADIQTDRRVPLEERSAMAHAGHRAALCMPIGPRGAGRAQAVLGIAWHEPRTMADEDLELARHLATAAAAAIERAEVLAAERSARSRAQELQRIGGLIASNLDAPAVLREIVSQAAALLGADACALRLVEGDRLVVRAVQGDVDELLAGERAPLNGGPTGEVLARRAPLAIEDLAADDRVPAGDSSLRARFASYLGAPILSPDGSLSGVLALYDRRRRRFRPDEIAALEAFANSATVALQNALLYQQVAQEKETSEAIIASIADGIVVIGADGRVEMWNRAAEAMTGVPARMALRRTLPDLLRTELGDHGDDAGQVLLEAERGGGAVEVRLQRGEREIWLSVRAAQLRDPVEDRVGTIYALRDVSEDRQLDQLKSDFVATVSHELRTPLTSIYGFAETLLRDDVAFGVDDRDTFLKYIASESERLTRLVDGLLSVARLEAGGVELDLVEVDIAEVLREVTMREAGRVRESHRVELVVPPEPLLAAADRDKLRQIVLNLVDNAIKYSPGGGTITVSGNRRLDVVEVRVADEGIGISVSDQRNLFRKFFRADARMTRGIRGIGLGLYLTRGFVNAMGGRIAVESEEGVGTTFIVELPLARGSVAPRRATEAA